MSEEEFVFGTAWFDEIAAALDVDTEGIQAMELVFETSTHARVLFHYADDVIERELPFVGIMPVKDTLDLPHLAQKLTIVGRYGEWAMMHYQFAPTNDLINAAVKLITQGNVTNE
jgi:hypothetical protein